MRISDLSSGVCSSDRSAGGAARARAPPWRSACCGRRPTAMPAWRPSPTPASPARHERMTGNPVRPHPWTVETSRVEYRDRFLTHRMDRCVTERGHVLDPFHIIELRDWCHCVALTEAGEQISEERRVGKEVVRTCRSWGSRYH